MQLNTDYVIKFMDSVNESFKIQNEFNQIQIEYNKNQNKINLVLLIWMIAMTIIQFFN